MAGFLQDSDGSDLHDMSSVIEGFQKKNSVGSMGSTTAMATTAGNHMVSCTTDKCLLCYYMYVYSVCVRGRSGRSLYFAPLSAEYYKQFNGRSQTRTVPIYITIIWFIYYFALLSVLSFLFTTAAVADSVYRENGINAFTKH